MSIGTPQLDTIPPAAGLASLVMTRLLSAVLSGRIVEGERLVVQKIADQLGVSATPVREALFSLADIGMIRLLPNRGGVCLPFGPTQLREIFQVRRVLEVEAARDACLALERDEIDRLEAETTALLARPALDESQSETAMTLDRRLHEAIRQSCGSNRLRHEIQRYDLLMQGIRRHVGNRLNLQRRALGEHLDILAPLRDRDAGRTADAMASHIRNTARDVEQLMFPEA